MSSVQSSSAVGALRALRLLTAESDRSTIRMATGLRIGEASDNAAFWSVATTMRFQHDLLSSVEDSLGVALGFFDAALAVQQPVLTNLDAMIDDIVLGRNDLLVPTGNNTPLMRKLDNDMLQRSAIIGNLIVSASFNGVNLLYRPNGKPTSLNIPTSMTRVNGSLQPISTTIDLTKTTLIDGDPGLTNFGALSRWLTDPFGWTSGRSFFRTNGWGPTGWTPTFYPSSGATGTTYQRGAVDTHMWMLNGVREATQNVFAYIGAVRSRLEGQLEQVKLLKTIYEKGVGGLVDADITAESARIKALDVQKQLATQMLSIVNNRSNTIVELLHA